MCIAPLICLLQSSEEQMYLQHDSGFQRYRGGGITGMK